MFHAMLDESGAEGVLVDRHGSNAAMLRFMTRKKSPAAGSPDVAQIVAAMRSQPAKGRGQRSPLYLWLRQNHARLLEEFTASAPSWPGLASALGDSGILNGEGKPPTAEGARTVWYRVRRDLAGKRKAAAIKPSPAPEPSFSSPTQPDAGDCVSASRRRFGTVKLRGPAADAPAALTTSLLVAETPTVDADEVLAKFIPSAAKRG